jgi:hypothetical protein
MYADAQGILPAAQGNSTVECPAVCHQGRASDDALTMRIENAPVYPRFRATCSADDEADALRYLIEGRPFGRVVLTI